MEKLSKFFIGSMLIGALLVGCGTDVDPNVTDQTEELDQEEMNPSVEESTDNSQSEE